MFRKIVAMVSFPWVFVGLVSMGYGYEVTKVEHGGAIDGQVDFSGTPPAPRVFQVKKDADICGKVRKLTKVEAREGKLKGVVVTLEKVAKGKPFEARTYKAGLPGEGEFQYQGGEGLGLSVRLKQCNFGPLTGVIATNQPVQFQNQDPIKHTLHTYALKGRKANILRTINTQNLAAHAHIAQSFSSDKMKHSRVVALTCDRHEFMENWMYVVDNPYFAISDEEGHFVIDQVPPGHYDLVAWHPVLGFQKKKVQVVQDAVAEVRFSFSK